MTARTAIKSNMMSMIPRKEGQNSVVNGHIGIKTLYFAHPMGSFFRLQVVCQRRVEVKIGHLEGGAIVPSSKRT